MNNNSLHEDKHDVKCSALLNCLTHVHIVWWSADCTQFKGARLNIPYKEFSKSSNMDKGK